MGDFSQPGLDLSERGEKLKKDIETVMQRRLISGMQRLQAKVEVFCAAYEGIDAVKAALMEGYKASSEEVAVTIKLVAHPVFALSCMCRDKELGAKVLDTAMEHIEKAILAAGGTFVLKTKPTFVTNDEGGEKKEGSDTGESGSDSDSENQDETMGQ